MRKIILVMSMALISILIFSSLTLADHKVTFSYDMEGKYELRENDWWDDEDYDSERYDTDYGFTIGYECTYKMERIEYGFGFETQLKRGISDFDGSEFKFSPLYGVIYVFFPSDDVNSAPFFVGRLGYNMHVGNQTYKNINGIETELGNGFYTAVGFGFNFNRSMGAIMYSLNTGEKTSNTTDYDRYVGYSKFSIVYGFRF